MPLAQPTVPDPSAAGWPGQAEEAAARRRLRRTLLLVALVAATVMYLHRQNLAYWAGAFLDAYVDAQQAMLEASGNTTEDGRSEFAVLLKGDATAAQFRDALAAVPAVSFSRESDFGGWVVITADPGDREVLAQVRGLAETRLVVPNRGLWICH